MSPFDLDTTTIDERTARALLTVISPPDTPAVMGGWVAARGAVETLQLALGDEPDHPWDSWVLADWRTTIRQRLADPDVASAFVASLAPDPRVVIPSDAEWPTGLIDLGHFAPLALWAEGDTSLLSRPRAARVAVVGSQAPTDYGVLVTQRLTRGLAGRGFQIVSGGAHGIDAEAHHSALDAGGATIVVLAGGLDNPFPPSNTKLFHSIRDAGGVLLTETPPSMVATNEGAQARHRITAAISGVVVTVEARRRSETTDAFDEAKALGRLVATVPGPVTSASSAGSHVLIRDLGAALVTDAADVVRLLNGDTRSATAPGLPAPSPRPMPPTGPSI
jgi:DNA processing protein